MGSITEQKPVKLVSSIISRNDQGFFEAQSLLEEEYGPVEGQVLTLPFDYTDYYAREMGGPLARKLIAFSKTISLDDIGKVKIRTNCFEEDLKAGGKRTVNIDPGYLTEAKLVLLTTKDYSHRIYVGHGVFAEVTLHFRGGSYTAWPWTYPDYASGEIRDYYLRVRNIYMKQIQDLKADV